MFLLGLYGLSGAVIQEDSAPSARIEKHYIASTADSAKSLEPFY